MDTETKTELRKTATEAKEATAETGEALAREVSKLRSELAGLIENVAEMGRERIHAITHNEKVTQSVAAGEAAIDRTSKELRALEHDIAEATRAYPWRALGIAAALGFLFGFLSRR